MMDARPEKPEKRASLSPQSLDIVSPESSAITITESEKLNNEKNLDRDLRSVSIAAVNEVERESKLFSGTSTTGEIADSVQLSRSCEQNRDYEVLQFPAANSDPFVDKGNVYAVP
ncbi:unnamed protein product [Brassica oleracea var. botrytis]